MPRRVYTGSQPSCFADRRIGRLEPGEEFDAPAELLAGLDRRGDIAVPAAQYDTDVAEAGARAQDTGRRQPSRKSGRAPGESA